MEEPKLKCNIVERGIFTKKSSLLSISLLPMWIVLFVKNIDIPIYFGYDWQFVGLERLLSYWNIVALISFVMIIKGLACFHQLQHRMKGSPGGLATTISKVNDRNFDYVNTLATILTLLGVILVPVDTLRGFLIFAILMALIIVCYQKTNLYYSNPIFAALGFKLYTINGNGIQNESIAIYRGDLRDGSCVRFYHISDNVYYLT